MDLIVDKEHPQRVVATVDHAPDRQDLLFAGSVLELIRGSHDIVHDEVGGCEIAELIGEHVQSEQREEAADVISSQIGPSILDVSPVSVEIIGRVVVEYDSLWGVSIRRARFSFIERFSEKA